MKYFNGFSLKGEESLFAPYLLEGETTVAGFSFGAQKALEYAYKSSQRIDKLVLLSPAFFQTQKSSFIRAQLRYFDTSQEAYVEQFMQNVSYPSSISLNTYLHTGTKDELESLLSYRWDRKIIQDVLDRGTTIEVYIGMKDKIIDADEAKIFFNQTVTYCIKDAGHLLKGKI